MWNLSHKLCIIHTHLYEYETKVKHSKVVVSNSVPNLSNYSMYLVLNWIHVTQNLYEYETRPSLFQLFQYTGHDRTEKYLPNLATIFEVIINVLTRVN